MEYIGITETSDPCFHLEIFDNLYKANIIITKNLSDKLIDKLVEHKDKCILHCTCTGMGSSKIEPFVPSVEQTIRQVKKLIENNFPVRQIVLRIDPIIPTTKGIETAINVLEAFKILEIKRVRFSFLDMYKHVKERFINSNIRLPYDTFHADINVRKSAFNKIYDKCLELGYEIVQTCGEPDFEVTPCISQMDIDILGLTNDITLVGNKKQRTHCSCPANKRQLISWEHNKNSCGHKCLYCYMKNLNISDNDTER
jgi:DNA repair photolyase